MVEFMKLRASYFFHAIQFFVEFDHIVCSNCLILKFPKDQTNNVTLIRQKAMTSAIISIEFSTRKLLNFHILPVKNYASIYFTSTNEERVIVDCRDERINVITLFLYILYFDPSVSDECKREVFMQPQVKHFNKRIFKLQILAIKITSKDENSIS